MQRLVLVLASLGCHQAAAAVLLRQEQGPTGLRETVCGVCYRLCPISCFAGTCGLQYGGTIKRFQATGQCYSCDAHDSAGHAPGSELKLCSALEAKATVSYVRKKPEKKKDKPKPVAGKPPIEGDPEAEVARAATMAAAAVQQLQAAAAIAARASQMKPRKHPPPVVPMSAPIGGKGGVTPGGPADDLSPEDKMQAVQAHQMATQIRATDALKVSEEAHKAWQLARNAYDQELPAFRKEELKIQVLEDSATRAEQFAKQSRKDYALAAAEAEEATRQKMSSGGSAAESQVEEAEAEELQSDAQDTQRRLMVAASAAAKTASSFS